MKTMR